MAITVAQVRAIAKLPAAAYLPDENVQLYVDASNTVMADHFEDSELSDEKQELIALYIAAHFAVLTEEAGGLIGQTAGEASEKYQMQKMGYGFASTRFGQTAMALDTSGVLASLATSPLKAQFRVV